MTDVLLRGGTWDEVTPERAGWRFLSFAVDRLGAGERSAGDTGESEVALVLLRGRCRIEAEGEAWELGPRQGVFEQLPWTLYLPRDTAYAVSATDATELAVCSARCDGRREPRLQRPDEVAIEVRGAGNATRQITNMLQPGFPAERLLVVEVLTPAGNWSSYPPHKHDENRGEQEVALEEVYYFRTPAPEAFAVQRLYSPRHELDVTETVRDGDLLLVPHGYHSTAAAHGFDLYYLNALAGDAYSMAAADDPALHWIRESWAGMERDPRVPLVTAAGRR